MSVSDSLVGTHLSDSELSATRHLPIKPDAILLEGEQVRLVPLELERDVAALFAVSSGQRIDFGRRAVEPYDADALIWRYMFDGPFGSSDELSSSLQSQVSAPNGLCFCVFEQSTGRQVGVCNYMNNFPAHLKVELGSIWYSPIAQRTNANLEATYLMLKHAFSLGYRRVEWKCDALNARSRRAALRMGFKFEGIQDSHFIVKGRNRDTAWFRILSSEWPSVRLHQENLLASPV